MTTACATAARPALFTREGVARAPNARTAKGEPLYVCQGRCSRCGGAGRSDKWYYTGYTCFDCNGSGQSPRMVEARLYDEATLARLDATRAKLRAKKAAAAAAAEQARQAAEDAARADRAEMLAADAWAIELRAYAPRNDFLADLARKLEARDLSDAQRAAAEVAISRLKAADHDAATSEWLGEEGERIAFEGEVRMCRFVRPAQFYGAGDTYLVKIATPRGVATWFTSKVFERGDRLVGKATIKKLGCYQGVKETTITRFLAAK